MNYTTIWLTSPALNRRLTLSLVSLFLAFLHLFLSENHWGGLLLAQTSAFIFLCRNNKWLWLLTRLKSISRRVFVCYVVKRASTIFEGKVNVEFLLKYTKTPGGKLTLPRLSLIAKHFLLSSSFLLPDPTWHNQFWGRYLQISWNFRLKVKAKKFVKFLQKQELILQSILLLDFLLNYLNTKHKLKYKNLKTAMFTLIIWFFHIIGWFQ